MNIVKNKKKIVPIIVLLLIIASISYFYLNGNKKYIGEVEGVIVSHSAEVAGKILNCPIELGSQIKKGDIVAVIDDTNQKYVVEQLALKLQKAQLAAENSKVGNGSTADNNYSVAKANYESAVVVAEKARQDYDKTKKLYEESAVSKDVLDKAKVSYETALNRAEASKAQFNKTSDKTAGNVADIEVELLESQLDQQKEILEKYTILAGCDGIIMSKNYSEGDIVRAGYNVADISSEEERYALFYLPEDKLDAIKYNQKVKVNLENNSTEGQIKYIDVKAQYTPKELQSAANRNQESIRVKILLPKGFDANVGQKLKVIL